jgi:hypothetical protein
MGMKSNVTTKVHGKMRKWTRKCARVRTRLTVRSCVRGRERERERERESNARTGQNKTVISRHFTHEWERLANSTCVPAVGTFPPSLPAPLADSLTLPYPRLSASLRQRSVFRAAGAARLLKNTLLADTCSFGPLFYIRICPFFLSLSLSHHAIALSPRTLGLERAWSEKMLNRHSSLRKCRQGEEFARATSEFYRR